MFSSVINGSLTIQNVGICSATAIILGISIAFIYRMRGECTKNFFIALALLPLLVEMVIMMVSGNLGTAVAVAGTFSLVRFRSMQGTARDIVFIFFAMALGLACGMGYVSFAVLICLLASFTYIFISYIPFREDSELEKDVRITVSEDFDYTNAFTSVFQAYASSYSLYRVKTVNMGAMYELRYRVRLHDINKEKEMIDEIRVRNGNLSVISSRYVGNTISL